MSQWAYTSIIDMTNGGLDNLTSVTIDGSLPSGINEMVVLYKAVQTDAANQAICFRLGDSGGIETTGYDNSTTAATVWENRTDGFFTAPNTTFDTPNTITGYTKMSRYDEGANLWIAETLAHEHANASTRMSFGYKTLSSTLTQMICTTSGGIANFTSGDIRIMYRTN